MDIKVLCSKPVEVVPLCKSIMDKIGIKDIVDQILPKSKYNDVTYGDMLEVLVQNRLNSPLPLYHVGEWFKGTAMREQYPEIGRINDDLLGRAVEMMAKHTNDIHAAIAMKAVSMFNVSLDVIHYDLSDVYFEGAKDRSEIARFGFAKNNKNKKRIKYGLDVSKDGAVPLHHEVYEGNIAQIKTVIENMRMLKMKLSVKHAIICQDRGLVSPGVLDKIDNNCLEFIVSAVLDDEVKSFMKSLDLRQFQELEYTKGGCIYKAYDTTYKYGKKVYRAVVVHSSKLEERRIKARKRQIKALEDELNRIIKLLNKWDYKERDFVQEKLTKLKSKYKKVWKYFSVRLDGKNGNLKLGYEIKETLLAEDNKIAGMYMLLTNIKVKDMTANDVLVTYKSRYKIERRNRDLKQHLKIRPVFLQNDDRIIGIVLVNVISLVVYSIIELLMERNKIKREGRILTFAVVRYIFHFLNLEIFYLDVKGKRVIRFTTIPPPIDKLLQVIGVWDEFLSTVKTMESVNFDVDEIKNDRKRWLEIEFGI